MKTTAAIILAFLLTACGGEMPIDQPQEEVLKTCTTKAVRSSSGSYTIHSTDGGVTWKHGACTEPNN